MIRDITIGQYYPAKSVLHRLDPRVKLVGTLLYLISLFLFNSIPGYVMTTLFLILVIRISKVPFSFIVRGLKPVIMLLMITVLFNLFLTRDGAVLFHAWIFTITEGGLRTAVYMAIRLIYLIIGSSLMTFTTTPNELTDGIEELLGPLNKIRVPVHEIAMIMSIALRFIPILLEETDKIMKAQIARGADLESGNMVAKQLEYLAHASGSGLVLGAHVPIALTSRADGPRARVASCVLALLAAHEKRKQRAENAWKLG